MNLTDGSVYDSSCTRCPRLFEFRTAVKAEHPDYFCAPVPPFGDPRARLLVVGLAPGMHGANATGRPFTGDWCGPLLYSTLHRFQFASRPDSVHVDDGLRLSDCRVTNAVKCLPPANKPELSEIRRCNSYLAAEIRRSSELKVVLALGTIAHQAVVEAYGGKLSAYRFAHAAEHQIGDGPVLLDSYHVSRYNTQTGRLTVPMFHAVVGRARQLLDQCHE